MTGEGEAQARELPPGIHVLGNAEMGVPSTKVDHVRDLIDEWAAGRGGVRAAIRNVLKDHSIPPAAEQELANVKVEGKPLPIEVAPACVHTEKYGTRSAALVEVGADSGTMPSFAVAPGPSYVTAFSDGAPLWHAEGAA